MADVLDKAAVKALRELVRQEVKPSGPLPPAPSQAIPSQTGVARPAGLKQGSGGGKSGAIASPISEVAGSRVYYPPQTVTTTDGAIVLRIEALKEVQFEDANGDTFTVRFQSS